MSNMFVYDCVSVITQARGVLPDVHTGHLTYLRVSVYITGRA